MEPPPSLQARAKAAWQEYQERQAAEEAEREQLAAARKAKMEQQYAEELAVLVEKILGVRPETVARPAFVEGLPFYGWGNQTLHLVSKCPVCAQYRGPDTMQFSTLAGLGARLPSYEPERVCADCERERLAKKPPDPTVEETFLVAFRALVTHFRAED